ncbi:MAG: hypothetical protein J6C33_05635 [Lachnospiraceae bacterium]|nr:hypothetical protein [Lachnospiraceae bacterium]
MWWGQHHFPDGCIITRDAFEHTVQTANKILSEKRVAPSLAEEFAYYVKLYHIFYQWEENDRKGDFYELCADEGIEYEGIPAFYYKD